MEEDIKMKLEALELKKLQGCKLLECRVINNNIILRQENIKLKRKNKELQEELENKDKESHFIQSRLDEANAKIIELNKIIDLMAKDIAENDIDEDICRKVKNKISEEDDCYGDDYDMCKDCVIEFYKKKASEENVSKR